MASDLPRDLAEEHKNGGGDIGSDGNGRCVVVGMDESEHSFYALEWALKTLVISSHRDGSHDHLVLIHAKPPCPPASGPGYILSAEVVLSMERAQDRQIQEFVNKAIQLCEEKQVKVEATVEIGDPRDLICEMVEKFKADFLVLGSHGYGAIKRAVLGSVSDYCAHHAKCPVVIVKKPHKKNHLHQQ